MPRLCRERFVPAVGRACLRDGRGVFHGVLNRKSSGTADTAPRTVVVIRGHEQPTAMGSRAIHGLHLSVEEMSEEIRGEGDDAVEPVPEAMSLNTFSLAGFWVGSKRRVELEV